MRKIYFLHSKVLIISLLIFFALISFELHAQENGQVFQSRGVPANPDAQIEYVQPDGSSVTIRMNGDAVVNWGTTTDGYTLLMNEENGFEYAIQSKNDGLIPCGMLAQNPEARSKDALTFLVAVKPGLLYSKAQVKAKKENHMFFVNKAKSSKAFPTTGIRSYIVILANFNNTSTSYSQTNFNNYMNQANYNGTGSFKDYYFENSYGQLTLNTTVTIWVTLPNTHDYYGPQSKWGEFAYHSVQAADASVNYANFDNDGDGTVDGIGIIHQGRGQEESGSTLDIWSHSWDLASAGYSSAQRTFDGVYAYSYTTQPELANSSGAMGNIGVMCHEFGHNLGAPDFYDTDYSTGGSYDGTGSWDCMAGGSWNNSGKTPAHHNGFTKWFYYGWLTPVTISASVSISMTNVEQNQVLYLYTTPTSNEYYLLENRQQIGFDAYLPGHGLIIYHADQNYITLHDGSNDINAGSHQGLYPKAAGGTINASSCPFPGTSSNTSFTDLTTPNSKSWAGANTNKPVTNIAEVGQTITFDFMGGASTPPTADFSANNTLPINSSATVTFTNLTTGSTPMTYIWSFSPTSVTYMSGSNANSANPQVRFNSLGAYTVSLYAQNASGNNTEVKTDYIHMGTPGLWTGLTSTNWNTTTNWENHMVPISTIDVSILPTAIFWPTKTGNLTIGTDCNSLNMASAYTELTVTGDLIIASGKSFFVDPLGIPNIYVGGDWTSNGFFTPGQSSVILNGNTNSLITAPSGTMTFFYDGFEGASTWTLTGEFETGAPGGLGGNYGSPDPTSAFMGSNVLGVDLTGLGSYPGDYESSLADRAYQAISPTINCTGFTNVSMNFQRWLGVESPSYDHAYIDISTDNGSTWTQIWTNTALIQESSWGLQNIDISSYANNQAQVKIMFCIGTSDGSWQYCGWNIDEFNVTGTGTFNAVFNNLSIEKSNAFVSTNGDVDVQSDLIVKPGAYFTNAAGNGINVSGNMIIEGTSSGKASYIDNGTTTVSGTTIMESYYSDDRWHFISSPVSNAVSNIFLDVYLKHWNEADSIWTYISSTDSLLRVGQGYEIWPTIGNPTIQYTGGILNSGNISPVLTATDQGGTSGIDDGEGWNLVGNPYPSAINWGTGNSPVSGYVRTNLDNTIYCWNGTGSQYATYNPAGGGGNGSGTNGGSQYIQSLQSFFVKALFTNPALTIPNSARVHSSQANLKSTTEVQLLRLLVSGNAGSDEILIEVNENSTPGFDSEFDAYKLWGYDNVPQFYFKTNDLNLSVNVVPSIILNDVFYLGFKAGMEDVFTIEATEIENFNTFEYILLEDLKTNTTVNLKENPVYEFSGFPFDNSNRFLLKFSDDFLGLESFNENLINVYAYQNTIHVQFLSDFNAGNLVVYDLLGQEVYKQKLIGIKNESVAVSAETGYYLVAFETCDQLIVKKVILK